jgi:ubiquinone/menaquinone biosynthesis C-methylase UbiE
MPEMFRGSAASLYAFVTRRISLFSDFNAAVADEILKKVTSGTVLDIGTGLAHLPIKIADRNLSLEIVGLDVSRDMMKIARANVRGADAENVQLLVGDVAQIGMQDESVDLAVATLSFHHWSNAAKALEELYRVLKSGGEVWIYEVNSDLTPQSEEWMKSKHNIIVRKFAPLAVRMLSKHAITVEHAQTILRDKRNRFAYAKVEQLEPLLVKMILIKK